MLEHNIIRKKQKRLWSVPHNQMA